MAKKKEKEVKDKVKVNPTYVCENCGNITEDKNFVCACRH